MKNAVSFIANTLETLRNKIVGAQYDIDFNEDLTSEIKHYNQSINILLWGYDDTEHKITDKTVKLKKLKSERKNLITAHIFKHKNLSERITETADDIHWKA